MSQPSKRARFSQSITEIQGISSQSISQDTSGDYSHDELERKAKELVRYALSCEYKKAVVRKEDIIKRILQGYTKQFKSVFTIAQLILNDTFGMILIEIPIREKTKVVSVSEATSSQNLSTETVSKMSSTNTYILCNALNQYIDVSSVIYYTEAEYARMGLLYLILSLIFVNEQVLSEGEMKKYLSKVGVSSISNTFGDLEKLVSTYTKQGYLYRVKRTENTSNNEPEWDYQWGPRAKVELQYKDLCKFIASFYEIEDMSSFQKNIFKTAGIE